MADHMRTELVVGALEMAVGQRRPEPSLIHHSDQGSQLGLNRSSQQCVGESMGSKGVCWDNAVAETFFATLKKELVYRHSWPTRRELETAAFDYIEAFYNRRPPRTARNALPNRLREPSSRRHFVLSHYQHIKINNNNH
jgi:putative transposase